jgi:hypothetical protein
MSQTSAPRNDRERERMVVQQAVHRAASSSRGWGWHFSDGPCEGDLYSRFESWAGNGLALNRPAEAAYRELGSTMNAERLGAARHEPRQPSHDASEDEEHQPDVSAEGPHLPFVRLAEIDQAVTPNGDAGDEDQPRQQGSGTCHVHRTSMRRFLWVRGLWRRARTALATPESTLQCWCLRSGQKENAWAAPQFHDFHCCCVKLAVNVLHLEREAVA